MARNFNGTSDRIRSSSFLPSSAPTSYTWSLWANGAASSGTASVVELLQFGADTGFYWSHTSATASHSPYQENASNAYFVAQVSALSAGVWYHLAATWNGGVLTSYLTGVLATSTSVTSIKWTTDYFNIGSNRSPAQWWGGAVADCALWSTALSADQIAALASGLRANHVAPQNMMVYWPIVGTSPEPDRSGNNINGTVTGTTVVADPPQLEAWAQSYDPYTLSSGTILVLPAQEW